MTDQPEPLTYTVEEIAGLLGVHRDTVLALVDKGYLRKLDGIGKTLVLRDEFERYRASGLTNGAA